MVGKKKTKVVQFGFDKGFEFPTPEPGQVVRYSGEYGKNFFYGELDNWDFKGSTAPVLETKTPTETWAEKWAKENEKDNDSL